MKSTLPIKELYFTYKNWVFKNPKKVYKYVMVFLLISFLLSLIEYFVFKPKYTAENNIPSIYSKSDNQMNTQNKNEKEMGGVVQELERYKEKEKKVGLTKEDKLQIEFLFNKYQKLKNGN